MIAKEDAANSESPAPDTSIGFRLKDGKASKLNSAPSGLTPLITRPSAPSFMIIEFEFIFIIDIKKACFLKFTVS